MTVNAQLLGASTISIFQSLCVLGYCASPLTVSALVIAILRYTWLGTIWIDLGYTSIIHFHWPVCKERTKIIGSLSSVLLLLIIRLVNSVILGYFIYI